MMDHGGARRGDGGMHGPMRGPMAAARRRSQDNVGYQEEDDCELPKPGEAK
jgi:hypothetical protein